MAKIIGNNDGPGGRNESCKIGSREAVPRLTTAKEVKQGKHPGAHIARVNVIAAESLFTPHECTHQQPRVRRRAQS